MKYTQPQLPYAHDALEPAISANTVDFHYGKHEKAYIDNLNNLIEGTEFADLPLEDVIRDAKGALFNNASQAWNHIFYFFSFSPSGSREPHGRLREEIDRTFGSFEQFKKAFEAPARACSAAAGYGCRATKTVRFSLPRAKMPRALSLPDCVRYSASMYGNTHTISTIRTDVPTPLNSYGASLTGTW